MEIKSNDRVTLVGQTGSGKSFLARYLCRGFPRLLCIDPKGEMDNWNLQLWNKKHLKGIYNGDPFRLRFVPEPGEEYRYEQFFKLAYEVGNMTVYIDELTSVVPHGKQPGPYLMSLYQRGRSLGVGTIACTQRPSWIPLAALSEATWLIMFRLKLVNDRKRMAEQMGPEVLTPFTAPHGFYISHQSWHEAQFFKGVKVTRENDTK